MKRGVIRFRSAAGEHDFGRFAAEEGGDLFARPFDRIAHLRRKLITTWWVSEIFLQKRPHRLQDGRIDRRRRVVIEISDLVRRNHRTGINGIPLVRRCKPVAVSRGLATNRGAHWHPIVCGQCQPGSDLTVVNSNLTGFTRNLLWGRCDVGAFWRTPLRGAISDPPGFLPDLLLWFKKSARRESAHDGENGKSEFHYWSAFDRLSINRVQARSASRGSSATSKQAASGRQPCSRKLSESLAAEIRLCPLPLNPCLWWISTKSMSMRPSSSCSPALGFSAPGIGASYSSQRY